jgi:MFS family permease
MTRGPVKFANFTAHASMSWKIALLVGLLTAIITAVVTAPVADKVTRMHGVSDFEGGRGMAIAFVLIPAGFIGGFLLGLLGTKLVHALEWSQFWKALGLSVLLGQAGLWGIAGLSLLSIPRPPLLDGETLALEVEVSVPLARVTPGARGPNGIRLSLYAGGKDNHYAEIERDRFREVDGQLVVTALAGLNSTPPFRTLSFHIEDHTWLAFDLSALPAVPTGKDLEWSEQRPMRDAQRSDPGAAPSDVLLRYRVVKQGPPRR